VEGAGVEFNGGGNPEPPPPNKELEPPALKEGVDPGKPLEPKEDPEAGTREGGNELNAEPPEGGGNPPDPPNKVFPVFWGCPPNNEPPEGGGNCPPAPPPNKEPPAVL